MGILQHETTEAQALNGAILRSTPNGHPANGAAKPEYSAPDADQALLEIQLAGLILQSPADARGITHNFQQLPYICESSTVSQILQAAYSLSRGGEGILPTSEAIRARLEEWADNPGSADPEASAAAAKAIPELIKLTPENITARDVANSLQSLHVHKSPPLSSEEIAAVKKPDTRQPSQKLPSIREKRDSKKKAAKAEKLAKFQAAGKPIIETHDRPLPDLLRDLGRAINRHNGTAPTIFHGTGGLREVVRNQDGVAVLESVSRERLQVLAAKNATWTVTPADAQLPREIAPPSALCQQFIASREYWENIPTIARISTAPFIDREGNICTRRGYHVTERVWLSLDDGFQLPDTTPTAANIAAAKTLLDKLFSEVAFKDQSSRANAFGLMLLPFVRLFIDSLQDGQTPIHLVDAPTQSSGKTHLVTICLSPFCEVIPTSDKADEKESQKEVFALLAEGTSYLFIDNVKSSLSSPEIATAVTSGKMRGRVLGASKTETVSSNIIWAATSNNAQLDGDIVSRSILIRLDTNSEAPENREYSFNPVQYIGQHRAEVQAAILTLVRAWLDAGRPMRQKKVSRFPAWERVIGGILETVGISGFLENHTEARENSDPETEAWRSFIEAWHAAHGEQFKTVEELLGTHGGEELKAIIGDKAPTKVFGKMLQSRRDKVIAGFKITKKTPRERVNKWQLVKMLSEKSEKQPIIGYGSD